MRNAVSTSSLCPGCQQPLRHVVLEGHYTKMVQVDLCCACHLVWFDAFELVRLSGLGWVQLLRAMLLQPVSRVVLSVDRSSLAQVGRALQCLQCGAAEHTPQATQCAYCESPLRMLVHHGDVLQLAPGTNPLALACHGCGQALDPTADTQCPHCDHAVAWTDLRSMQPLLDAVEPLLRAQQPRQARPWGARLREQQGNHRATQCHRWLRHANLVSDDEEVSWRRLRDHLLQWRVWWRLALLGMVLWFLFRRS